MDGYVCRQKTDKQRFSSFCAPLLTLVGKVDASPMGVEAGYCILQEAKVRDVPEGGVVTQTAEEMGYIPKEQKKTEGHRGESSQDKLQNRETYQREKRHRRHRRAKRPRAAQVREPSRLRKTHKEEKGKPRQACKQVRRAWRRWRRTEVR